MKKDCTFIGKPCRRCGGEVRYKTNKTCVSCAKGTARRWYSEHTDLASERSKVYREVNKDELNEYGRAWRAANPEKAARYHKTANIRKRFGMEWGVYLAMIAMHDGVCAICRQTCSTRNGLAIDHDHKTGRVRGLLCHNCNTGLGKFKDSPALLEGAIRYLARDFVLPDVGLGSNVSQSHGEVNARDFNTVDESQDL